MGEGSRYEVSISGGDLAAARAALDAAGIATVASDDAPRTRRQRPWYLRGAFPIVLVIVIAFFSQRVLADGDTEQASYSDFRDQVQEAPETIVCVTIDPGDTEIVVQQVNGPDYETGYPPASEAGLVDTLQSKGIETIVEDTSGGSVLRLLVYLLPFLLFFAFWSFLTRRARREREAFEETVTRALVASVKADSERSAVKRVRDILPVGGEKYEVSARQ